MAYYLNRNGGLTGQMSINAMTKPIGAHQITVDGDTIHLVVRGDFLLEDAKQVNAEVEAVLYGLGRAFILADQSSARATPPDARRYLVDWSRKHRVSAAVMFGGSVATRTVATLILTALRIFKADSVPTCFTATEAEARAWLNVQREKLLSQPSE